jgi:hypothetical protein
MYFFCKTFHCTPEQYYAQECGDIDTLLLFENEVRIMKADKMEEASRNARHH